MPERTYVTASPTQTAHLSFDSPAEPRSISAHIQQGSHSTCWEERRFSVFAIARLPQAGEAGGFIPQPHHYRTSQGIGQPTAAQSGAQCELRPYTLFLLLFQRSCAMQTAFPCSHFTSIPNERIALRIRSPCVRPQGRTGSSSKVQAFVWFAHRAKGQYSCRSLYIA